MIIVTQRAWDKGSDLSVNASERCLFSLVFQKPGITLLKARQRGRGWLTTLASWRRPGWPWLYPCPTAWVPLLSGTTTIITQSSWEASLGGRQQQRQEQEHRCPIMIPYHGVSALLSVLILLMWGESRKIALVISLTLSGTLLWTKILSFNGAEAAAPVMLTAWISTEEEMFKICRLIVGFHLFYGRRLIGTCVLHFIGRPGCG